MTDTLTIYGAPASQPSRTVFWTCLLNDLPFTLGVGGEASPEQSNPRGQVPWIVDGDFVLAEMSAIICYLATKHRCTDLYPEDLQTRARIQQFLHMQHSLVRAATLKLMAPHVIKPIRNELSRGRQGNPLSSAMLQEVSMSAYASDDPLKDGGKVVHVIVGFLENFYFNDSSPFVCATENVSLADLACYGELGQFTFAKLFDFRGYPRTERWLEAMTKVPHHDAIHAYNITLGDIATKPNTIDRFTAASQAGIAALKETRLIM